MAHNDHDNMTQNIPTGAFDTDWNATDIAQLQPGHLTRSKPVRGWERKPASPFTKQRLRVGKVWRRAFPPVGRAPSNNATGEVEERTIKRLRAGQGTQSPLKIVKRLCLGANNGVGLQWDRIESPTKRIVTRSAAADDLVALSDEEEEDSGSDQQTEEVQGTVIEILGEDGTTLRLNPDQAQNDGDWSDEDASDNGTEEPSDVALGQMHEDTVAAPTRDIEPANEISLKTLDSMRSPALAPAPIVLPAGFVSPVRRKHIPSRQNEPRKSDVSRRRTLPQTFAPAADKEHTSTPTKESDDILDTSDTKEKPEMETGELQEGHGDQATNAERIKVSEGLTMDSNEDEWEDLQEEPVTDGEGAQMSGDVAVKSLELDSSADSGQQREGNKTSPATRSPYQQLDLPLRRSPRRKSSSPVKQRSFSSFVDPASHLVAFSPVKNLLCDTPEAKQQIMMDRDETMQDLINESPLVLERSVSAPPEEPQMSARRSEKPRVSDDTALLQAFLNRAAENKSSRRLSATKRESLSNRRDSDTVRQALASPAKPEVLGALDPNSPSPKKSIVAFEDLKPIQDEDATVGSPLQSSGEAENLQGRTTRRSHRDKRRVERAAPLAHTRISLRGNTDPVILKRSEAQELATMTRANTRKNKAGSVMPTLRLTKLITEKAPIEASPETETAHTVRPGVRSVKWDETLAYYQEAPTEPEVQLFELGDSKTAPKLQKAPPALVEENDSDEAIPAPPPAAETPSKPKVRKLRAPRTAASSGKTAAASGPVEEVLESAPTMLKPKQSRRSRIATPAKGSETSSLLPEEVATEPSVDATATATRPKAVPRKKAASRLPAPAPVSLSTSSHEGASLIASPPKKKSTNGAQATKNPVTKLDFQTKLSAPSKPADSLTAGGPPGLMSPAKRGGRNIVFGNVPQGPVFGAKADAADERKAPGLSSPAKKRTRRAA